MKKRHLIILRLAGEVCTKSSQTRKSFNRRLKRNIRDALRRCGVDDFRIHDQWFRFDVETDDDAAADVLARVPGIQSLAVAEAYEWENLDDILDVAAPFFAERVDGKDFAVRTSRVGPREQIPFTSMDVDRELGTKLVEAGGSVDLDNPEVVAGVEVREEQFFIFDRELDGPGGLPLGVEGRALSLLSGGFDSAVATWMMYKRGIEADFLFFNLGGPEHERSVRAIANELDRLWTYGSRPKLCIVDFRSIVAEMKSKVPGRYWQLLLKRLMMRAASSLARRFDYPVLLTGESCGQVSSQTLQNLAAITAPIETPILRPLVAFNKEQIIALSREAKTHDLSAGVEEFCSLEGGRPVTACPPEKLDEQEALLDLDLIDTMIEDRKLLEVRDMEVEIVVDTEIDEIPEDAVVFDLRSEAAFAAWNYPDSIQFDFPRLLQSFVQLPKDKTYVLYCEIGLKSATLAEKMQEFGYEAFSFRDGLKSIMRYAKQ